MKEAILEDLKKIERENQISIIYAIESGSRVWEIESQDSDYDIRFVFSRNKDDYLSLDKKADVIELKNNDEDYSGFDIFKFLQLVRNSNPSVIEWVQSNIVYLNKFKHFNKLSIEAKNNFNPLALFQHYKSLCKQNYLKYIKDGSDIRYKRYLYCLRGMLNAIYVSNHKDLPPINFNNILECKLGLSKNFVNRIKDILKIKKEGFEKDNVKRITIFDKEIESFLKSTNEPQSRRKFDIKVFDYMLRANIK